MCWLVCVDNDLKSGSLMEKMNLLYDSGFGRKLNQHAPFQFRVMTQLVHCHIIKQTSSMKGFIHIDIKTRSCTCKIVNILSGYNCILICCKCLSVQSQIAISFASCTCK